MKNLSSLFSNNKKWAADILAREPEYFRKLANQQRPEYLWIGCSDSRVPANEIVDLAPGELFVHRNIANVVVYSDLNCLSVIEFAVRVLKVRHIIVCGHYGCSGVKNALFPHEGSYGLADNWLRHVREIAARHRHELDGLDVESARLDRLAELKSGITILGAQTADWNPVKAKDVAQAFLTAYGDDMVGVFAQDDNSGAAAAEVFKAAGRGDIKVVGTGGTIDGLKAIREGLMYGTMDQSPTTDAQQALKFAIMLANGESLPEKRNIIPMPKITAENVGDFKGEW